MSDLKIIGLILHFRTIDSTVNCISSIFHEGIKCVYIIDNSEDECYSINLVKIRVRRLIDNGLILRVKSSNKNFGFAKGVNIGLTEIIQNEKNYKSILLINSDAELLPRSLIELTKELSSAKIVIPIIKDGDKKNSLFGYYQISTALLFNNHFINTIRYPSGCCMLMDKDIVCSNLYDEDFFFYGEDVFLGFTLNKKSIYVKECKSAFIKHIGANSSKKGSIFYEYNINKSHFFLGIKMAKSNLLKSIFIFIRIIILTIRAIFRSMRFRNTIAIKGLLLAICDLINNKHRDLTPRIKNEN